MCNNLVYLPGTVVLIASPLKWRHLEKGRTDIHTVTVSGTFHNLENNTRITQWYPLVNKWSTDLGSGHQGKRKLSGHTH